MQEPVPEFHSLVPAHVWITLRSAIQEIINPSGRWQPVIFMPHPQLFSWFPSSQPSGFKPGAVVGHSSGSETHQLPEKPMHRYTVMKIYICMYIYIKIMKYRCAYIHTHDYMFICRYIYRDGEKERGIDKWTLHPPCNCNYVFHSYSGLNWGQPAEKQGPVVEGKQVQAALGYGGPLL